MHELTAPSPAKKGFYIPSLDGIRAVSFLMVFMAHCGMDNMIPGGLGVTVFFFLSGYLITTLLRTEVASTGKISLRDFYMRRILRIMPPFYVTLLLAILLHLTGVFPSELELKPLLFQIFHIGNYWTVIQADLPNGLDHVARGTNVLWSLAVEEHFYLIFPFLYVLMRPRMSVRWQTLTLVFICLAILAWRAVLVMYFHNPSALQLATHEEWRTFCATDTRADSILWGCIFAICCNPMLDKPFATGKRLGVWLGVSVAVFALTLFYRDGVFRETARYTLHGVALIPIFTAAIVWHKSAAFRWLNWKPIRQLGVLSYSLYLVHFTIIYIVQDHLTLESMTSDNLRSLVQGIVAFLGSLTVALLYFQFIEKPFAKMRKKFSPGSPSGKTEEKSAFNVEDMAQPMRKMAV